MDERDAELRALLEAAVRTPRGLETRAAAAMAATAPRLAGGRSRLMSLAAGVAALLLTLGLDPLTPLRHPPVPQSPGLAQASAAAEAPSGAAADEQQSPEQKELAPSRARAAEFVRAHYAKDAEMLLAGGLLTTDRQASRDLLEQAASQGGSPTAWAAYALHLLDESPHYRRPGLSGADPADPRRVAEEVEMVRGLEAPDRLTEEQAAPVLAALQKWERADPQNSAPLVFEVWCLYGLHEDAEALARWREAGQRPGFDVRYWHQAGAVARLLTRMGMGGSDAAMASFMVGNTWTASSFLRECARIGSYEGRRAELRGRPQDALAWWEATMAVGRHGQESADTLIQILTMNAIEGIGSQYVWRWVPDRTSGIPGGPLLGGRLFEGQAYAFYVRRAGQQAADEVRDRLARAKVRSQLMRRGTEKWLPMPRYVWVLGGAVTATALTVLLLVSFVMSGTWRRRQADEATRLGGRARVFLATLAVLPGAAGSILASTPAVDKAPAGLDPLWGVTASLALALLLPFVAAWRTRRPEARVLTAWRGNLRLTLPLAIALCGGLALCLAVVGKSLQATWLNQFYAGTSNEVARMAQAVGPEWEHPRLPPDAWRAEPAPEGEMGRG